MKTRSLILLMLTAGIFTSCEHHSVYDSDSTKTLTVPKGFDWDVTENVKFTVTSPVETTVQVFEDEACTSLLAVLPANQKAVEYNLNILKGTSELYVQYPNKEGKLAVIPAGLTATKSNDKWQVNVHLPENGTGQGNFFDKQEGIIYYPAPSKGWGTIFFEDMWPELGDYDFNDVAIWYKIQLHTKANAIYVSIRLNALGGEQPSQLCLQIDDVPCSAISKLGELPNNGDGTGKYTLETSGDSPAVFSFDWGNKKGSNGGKYFNTETAYQVSSEVLDATQLGFIVYIKDGLDVAQLDSYSFNFFIRKTDGTEIHLKGYQPTEAFKARYQEIVAEQENLDPESYYSTKDGFVWGVKVPEGIDHPTEKTDMTKAYKFFGEWVTSNGDKRVNWYKEQSGKNLRINVRK